MSKSLPRLETKDNSMQLIVDGKPFIMLSGEIHNSSSSCMEYMENEVWPALEYLNLNSVIAPVYWELIEPKEDSFDFSLVDGLIEGARKRNVKLVLLWFATWKNTWSTYAPEWVKKDITRFPRTETPAGKICGQISCTSEEACKADAKAFGKLMGHIRDVDSEHQTVVMVQLENETGLLTDSRDRSPKAEELFNVPIPASLIEYLTVNEAELLPEVKTPWQKNGSKTTGTWSEVFGGAADEIFMAWHIGSFVEQVALAGKAEYDIPYFVNAWLIQFENQYPGQYPSGGPVSGMIDLWRAAAPTICLTAPDIYLSNFADVCRIYRRSDNPLFIPEARNDVSASANAFYSIAEHDAICFAPFAIESMVNKNTVTHIVAAETVAENTNAVSSSNGAPELLSETYKLLAGMHDLIAKYQGTGRMVGLLQTDGDRRSFQLGNYTLRIQFNELFVAGKTPGGGLIIAVSDDEFIVAGHRFTMFADPLPGDRDVEIDWLAIDEGRYANGKWIKGRCLNGDERAVSFKDKPKILHVKIYKVKK